MTERPEVWQHSTSRLIKPYLGNVREPETRREALLELIGWTLLTGESGVTFDAWVETFRGFLQKFGIDPKGKAGQSMLHEFVENAQIENYGAYDEWTYCSWCGEAYHLPASVRAANRIIAGVGVCDQCFAEEAYADPQFPVQQSEDEQQDERDWLAGSPPDDHDADDEEGGFEDKPTTTPEDDLAELEEYEQLLLGGARMSYEEFTNTRAKRKSSISSEEASKQLRKLIEG